MASLNNFHTGNGVQLRRTQYPDEGRRMQAIGLGLVSNRDWNLTDQVPTAWAQHRANDYVGLHHVAPRYTERRDVYNRDLLVPTVPYVVRRRGATAESTLLHDAPHGATSIRPSPYQRRGLCCLRTGLVRLSPNSSRVRPTPY